MTTSVRSRSHDRDGLSIIAPARLHLGFVDLNGTLGRRFGSLGMALQQPYTHVVMRQAGRCSASGPDAERALAYARTLLRQAGRADGVDIMIEQAIPTHSGLGSGTQLALAVGSGIARLFALDWDSVEIARRLGRGARSGIGIAAFDQGGFLVDGGRGAATELPPLIARLPVPEHWRVLLIFDQARQGVHGEAEHRAFAELPEFTEGRAAELCRLLLMQALPALVETDIDAFGAAISRIQRHIGDYFAPLQGGEHFASPAVAQALDWLSRRGISGLGQSSWGPTGFALCGNETDGRRLLAAAEQRWSASSLRFALVGPRNTAGTITCLSLTRSV